MGSENVLFCTSGHVAEKGKFLRRVITHQVKKLKQTALAKGFGGVEGCVG